MRGQKIKEILDFKPHLKDKLFSFGFLLIQGDGVDQKEYLF